jgi:hypothetical protein
MYELHELNMERATEAGAFAWWLGSQDPSRVLGVTARSCPLATYLVEVFGGMVEVGCTGAVDTAAGVWWMPPYLVSFIAGWDNEVSYAEGGACNVAAAQRVLASIRPDVFDEVA